MAALDAVERALPHLAAQRSSGATKPEHVEAIGDHRHETSVTMGDDHPMLIHRRVGPRSSRLTFVCEAGTTGAHDPDDLQSRLRRWRAAIDVRHTEDERSAYAEDAAELERVLQAAVCSTELDWTSATLTPASAGRHPMIGVWSADARRLLRYGLPVDPFGDGSLSANLQLALSRDADTIHVTAEKPTSNPGIMVTIGGAPTVIVRSSALDPFARLRAIALADERGYALLDVE